MSRKRFLTPPTLTDGDDGAPRSLMTEMFQRKRGGTTLTFQLTPGTQETASFGVIREAPVFFIV